MAATVVGTGGASIPADPPMDRRRLIAFFAMVFGMFMSILDIQICLLYTSDAADE